jgi:addiction module HigA family antidote
MNKGDLVNEVTKVVGTKKEAKAAVDCVFSSITKAAESLGVTRKTFSMLLNGKSGISPEMALRLSKVFGRTPEGWLRIQLQFDLWKVK